MIKTSPKKEFRDSAIEKVKIAGLEFSYTNKEGIIKHKDRIYIPFNVAKKSSLKGLQLCVHKSTGNKYFVVIFWFKKKQKIYKTHDHKMTLTKDFRKIQLTTLFGQTMMGKLCRKTKY